MTPADIARAFHCPHHIAVRLFHKETRGYEAIQRLGPMRVHWKRGHGWHMFNRPISIRDFEA